MGELGIKEKALTTGEVGALSLLLKTTSGHHSCSPFAIIATSPHLFKPNGLKNLDNPGPFANRQAGTGSFSSSSLGALENEPGRQAWFR
jgi:hypothetical protein